MTSRAVAKCVSTASGIGCVCVACLVVRVLFLCETGCVPLSVSPLFL
jgi:hypothetical protein